MESTPSEYLSTYSLPLLKSQRGFVGNPAMKLGVFVVIATVVAVAGYFAALEFLGSDDQAQDDRRPVAVSRGTLLDDITASGSIAFPELESLRFQISGNVGEVLVEEGDLVEQGDPLILLDQVTIAGLESALAAAEISFQEAGEDLANLLEGATSLERAIAQSNLADARVASMNAAADLAEFTSESGADSPATAAARDELAEANESLAEAIATAEDDAAAQADLVAAAQEDSDEAKNEYNSQLTGWFGSVVTAEDQLLDPESLLSKWGVTVDSIFEESAALIESPPDDLTTPWNESVVWVWTHLTPYPILTNCEATSFTARCPSAEIEDAWDAKVAAEESLQEAIDDLGAAAKVQQNLIDAAQEEVEDAAEAVVESVNDIEINALAATLAELLELEKDAEAAVEALDDLDTLEIKLATAAVNETNALLENARAELEAANLVAPFPGIVSSISVEPGDGVNRTTPTIDLLDPTVITVDGTIDEIDVLSVRVGDEVGVTLDALPNQPLKGVISEIGDGVNQQGIIEFPMTVSITPPEGVELIEGLSATATIVLNQIDDAILVPLQAVGGTFDQPTVDVVTENGFATTPVVLGSSEDFWVVVESGISEGQEVLMTIADSVDPLQQLFGGGAIRIPGGGATFTVPAQGGGRPRGGNAGGAR